MRNKKIIKFLMEEGFVVFRYPRFNDWIGIMNKTNSLIKEKSFGSPQHKETEKLHRRSMRQRLVAIREGRAVYLVATINGAIIGSASVWLIPGEPGRGSLEISIRSKIPGTRKTLWGKGIGKKLVRAIILEAKTILMVKIVKLGVYAVNHRAIKLYEKCGFKETYRVRREKYHYGVMRDRVYMQKYLR